MVLEVLRFIIWVHIFFIAIVVGAYIATGLFAVVGSLVRSAINRKKR
jgi:hypothetical protein